MYEGTKAISDFEEIEESEIGGNDPLPANFDDDDYGDLGLAFNQKDNFNMLSPDNGSIKNVNINDIDLEEDFNPQKDVVMGLMKQNVKDRASKKSKHSTQKEGGIKSKKSMGDDGVIMSDGSRSRSRKKKVKKIKKKSKYDEDEGSWSD